VIEITGIEAVTDRTQQRERIGGFAPTLPKLVLTVFKSARLEITAVRDLAHRLGTTGQTKLGGVSDSASGAPKPTH
jgi:hypothetical protein